MSTKKREQYDPGKIDKIASYLQIYHERGEPIDYEIIVDNFKAVRRTNDIAMFPLYENFIDADTQLMEILLYSGNSNNNDKYVFTFKDEAKETLSGIDIKAHIQEQVTEQVQQQTRDQELEQLKTKNAELLTEVAELEKEIEQLEKDKAAIEASQSPLRGILGEVGSSFVESFIRRNPQIIASIPGGQALAGLIESDTKRKEQEQQSHDPQGPPDVSFKPKTETQVSGGENSALNEEDTSAIAFVNQLKEQFTKEEFDSILLILESLAEDKSKIDLIINHVNLKTKNHEIQF